MQPGRRGRWFVLAAVVLLALTLVQQSLVYIARVDLSAAHVLVQTARAADGERIESAERSHEQTATRLKAAGPDDGAEEPESSAKRLVQTTEAEPTRARRRVAGVDGDMSLPGVLQRAAASVARPSTGGRPGLELILMPVSLNYGHLGLNLLLNMQRLGYDHVLMLAPDERTCRNATNLSPLPTACVWDGRWARDAQLRERASAWESFCSRGDCTSRGEPTASYRTWLSRWLAKARLNALGYDTLLIDVDVALADDVLAFFAAPPLDRWAASRALRAARAA